MLAMAAASVSSHVYASVLLLVITLMTPIYGYNEYLSACCGLKLMDTSQRVIIETGRTLTPGVYKAVSLRVCTTEEMVIGVWTPVNAQTFQLKWQTTFTPIAADTFKDWVTVGFEDALTVATNDRVGFYSATSLTALRKLNVPYVVDDASDPSSVQLSSQQFNESSAPFVAGQLQITVQDLRWPRTFAPYFRFCTTSDCSDISTTTSTSAISTTGRPASDLPFCGCQSHCSPDDALRQPIEDYDRILDLLDLETTLMRSHIRTLTSATVQTGFCPDDFAPGVYGIGSCYVVYRSYLQLAEAAVRCSADHGANLVAIESDIEQQFIYNIVTNNGSRAAGGETFWTSGMYSFMTNQWMWYRQDWTPRSPIASNTFRGWQNNAEPRPATDLEACLVVDVDSSTGEMYWRNDICIFQNYYICEIPKICY